MVTVFMVQRSRCKWRIETEKGIVLYDDFYGNRFQAEDFVKAYVSSFHCWYYEMRPMEKK